MYYPLPRVLQVFQHPPSSLLQATQLGLIKPWLVSRYLCPTNGSPLLIHSHFRCPSDQLDGPLPTGPCVAQCVVGPAKGQACKPSATFLEFFNQYFNINLKSNHPYICVLQHDNVAISQCQLTRYELFHPEFLTKCVFAFLVCFKVICTST